MYQIEFSDENIIYIESNLKKKVTKKINLNKVIEDNHVFYKKKNFWRNI